MLMNTLAPRSTAAAHLAALPNPPAGKTDWPWDSAAPQPAPLPGGREWPRITVVTPSFNQAPYLEETLRSVLLQGYPQLEYLVMDGGSTDGSVAILRQYAPWLQGWVSEADRGQSHAIEKGFAQANGEILAWLNSDDLYLPGTLFAIAERFLARPEAVLVYGEAAHITPEGQPRADTPCARPYDRRWLLEQSNLIPQPAAFFRKEAYRAADGLDEALHYVMDWDLWLRLDRYGPAVFVPRQLALMRIYPTAKFQSGGRHMHSELRQVIARHGGQGLPQAARERLAEEHLALAFAAYSGGDPQTGAVELAYVLENAPEWSRDRARLPAAIARAAWQAFLQHQVSPLEFAQRVTQHLPVEVEHPRRLEGRTLGLVEEALAFHYWQRAERRAARGHAWQAMQRSRRQAANRGLWSLIVRSFGRAPAGRTRA